MSIFFSIDDTASAIRAIQKRLRILSQSDDRLPTVFIDGIYGAETEATVRAFQETRGLPVSGTVDIETHRRITEEYDALLRRAELAAGSPDFESYEGNAISEGDEFDGVIALQLLFRSISEQDERFRISADGSYGAETAAAVRLFNALRGRDEDTRVDREFWNELALFAGRRSEN